MLFRGDGIPEAKGRAAELFEKAAAEGNEGALGQMLGAGTACWVLARLGGVVPARGALTCTVQLLASISGRCTSRAMGCPPTQGATTPQTVNTVPHPTDMPPQLRPLRLLPRKQGGRKQLRGEALLGGQRLLGAQFECKVWVCSLGVRRQLGLCNYRAWSRRGLIPNDGVG